MRDMSPVRDRLGCVLAVWCSLACTMGAVDQKAMMTKRGSQQCVHQSWAGHTVIVLEELASVQMACTVEIFCRRATQSRRKLSFTAGLPGLPPVGGRSPAGGFSQESRWSDKGHSDEQGLGASCEVVSNLGPSSGLERAFGISQCVDPQAGLQ